MSSLADMQQFCLWQTKCLSEICHTSITFAKHHKAILYSPSGGHLIKLITSITHNRPCLTAWLHKGRISKESTIFLSIGSERIKNSIRLLAMEDNTWKLVSDYLFKANPIRFIKLAFLNNLFLSLSQKSYFQAVNENYITPTKASIKTPCLHLCMLSLFKNLVNIFGSQELSVAELTGKLTHTYVQITQFHKVMTWQPLSKLPLHFR